MKKHTYIALALIIFSLLTAAGCAKKPDDTNVAAVATQLEMTLAELAEFNGKDGQPAYIAVDGIIYDVSGSSRWNNGEHNGYAAGLDLTEFIKNESPHGVSVLKRMPVVGKIIE